MVPWYVCSIYSTSRVRYLNKPTTVLSYLHNYTLQGKDNVTVSTKTNFGPRTEHGLTLTDCQDALHRIDDQNTRNKIRLPENLKSALKQKESSTANVRQTITMP